MPSTTKEKLLSSPSSSKRNKERDSSKAKERSRRDGDRPATTPGAVPSSSDRLERRKESGSGGKSSSTSAPATTPGAVPSSDRRERRKESGSGKPKSSSSSSRPGAVSSTGRDKRKGGPRSKKFSGKSNDSSGSSNPRGSRPISEEKRNYLAPTASDRGPSATPPSANEMNSEIVADPVDDAEMQTTTNALRDKNRQVEALRAELQRRDEEQASQSRRRGIPFWGKVCLGSLVLIAAAVAAVVTLTGGGGGDEATQPAKVLNSTSEPTAKANTLVPTDSPTASPDGQSVFDPPSAGTCSKISEGLPVDGQEEMSMQPFSIIINVYLLADISSDLWRPEMVKNIQQLVMPEVVGCENTTLDYLFTVGNALVDKDKVGMVPCEDEKSGPCYTVEFPVNLFMKKDVVSYDLDELNQLIEGVFQTSTSLVVSAQDENSKVINNIGSVTSVPITPSPSQQPSSILTTSPSTLHSSLQPTMSSTSKATPGPTVTPASGPTLAPTLAPSLGPSLFPSIGPSLAPASGSTIQPSLLPTIQPTVPPSPLPTPGPTASPSPLPTPWPTVPPSPLPTPGPTTTLTPGPSDSPSRAPSATPSLQPSVAPTSKCTRLETTLSRFAPFDGNKGQALSWLCSDDTWEPPVDAADETGLWEERFALAVFYYATNGGGWANNAGWLTAVDICSWHGITDCNGDGSVTKVELLLSRGRNFGLVGDFPEEMRALGNLEYIQFGNNADLSGSFPSFLPELMKLTYLAIGNTGRTGSIPSELWTMTQLQTVRMWGNFLSGPIPSGIGTLTDLAEFVVAYNDLSGSLPDEFGGMTQLTNFRVEENYLVGTVPPLPSNTYAACSLAREFSGADYQNRKTEGNCFTNTINAPPGCALTANCS